MALSVKYFMIISLFHCKKTVTATEVETIDEKTFELVNMLEDNYVLPLVDVDTYKKYVLSHEKEYSFVVFFTVSQNCLMCESPYDEFMILAKSYKKSKESNMLFFGIVDFVESPNIFDMMRLKSAPAIAIFPADKNKEVHLFLDMAGDIYLAENMAFLIDKKIHVKILIERSYLVANIVGWSIFLIPVLYFVYQYERDDLIDIVRSGHVWAMSSVVYCGLMSSGQIYNHIMQPPLIDLSEEEGEVNVTSQIESYAAALMIISISIGMIIIIEGRGGVQRVKSRRNPPACVVGLTIVIVCFSLYAYMLKRKLSNRYPYSVIF